MDIEHERVNQADIADIRQPDAKPTQVSTVVSAMGLVAAAEIDQQIATAHKYPRSVKEFRNKAMTMATLNETVAGECLFALPRDGKVIEGPSIRLAEIILSAWGNCRTASRIVQEDDEYIVAQGVFHDLENNVAIQKETQRRIKDKQGKRYKLDMILMTGNAAQSIAMRNAVVTGVPRAIWWDVYQAARDVAAGDQRSMETKRAEAIKRFAIYGVDLPAILTVLNRRDELEIDREDIVRLVGMYTAIKDNESTIEQLFPKPAVDVGALRKEAPVKEKPPTQTVAPASLGDTSGFGTPGVAHAEPPQDPPAQKDVKPRRARRSSGSIE